MKRTNVLKISILFILFMLYFLVTFRDTVSACGSRIFDSVADLRRVSAPFIGICFAHSDKAYYLVLRRLKKWVLVTFIRKIEKVRLLGRTNFLAFTNFCLIDELFYYELRR